MKDSTDIMGRLIVVLVRRPINGLTWDAGMCGAVYVTLKE